MGVIHTHMCDAYMYILFFNLILITSFVPVGCDASGECWIEKEDAEEKLIYYFRRRYIVLSLSGGDRVSGIQFLRDGKNMIVCHWFKKRKDNATEEIVENGSFECIKSRRLIILFPNCYRKTDENGMKIERKNFEIN